MESQDNKKLTITSFITAVFKYQRHYALPTFKSSFSVCMPSACRKYKNL